MFARMIPLLFCCVTFMPAFSQESQITYAPYAHKLTNFGCWAPDSNWIVYDIRSGKVDNIFDGDRIERVHVENGTIEVLYQSNEGACCGVASYSPVDERIIFIHGPENPETGWTYGMSRRRGVIRYADGRTETVDAANFAPPFTPGSLRGGSHVHIFSGDGHWISFTYNDQILSELDSDPNVPEHDADLRNIGVSVPLGPVKVNRNHPRNYDGAYFSVVVSKTENQPKLCSDEIKKGYEESWIGTDGYVQADGKRQKKAIAMLGDLVVLDKMGKEQVLTEVFVLDLPELADNLRIEGDGPLAGTEFRRPSPPQSVVQRRLTFTSDRTYPGVQGIRHWVRSCPDGSRIAFLMRDENGISQIWTVSPNGGEPQQWTNNSCDVGSTFTWSPDGTRIAYIMDNSVFISSEKETVRLTPKSSDEDAPLEFAAVFSPDGSKIAYLRNVRHENGNRYPQIFVVKASCIEQDQ